MVERRKEGEEKFLVLLKRSTGAAFRLLLLALLLFSGHWVYVRLLEDPVFQVKEIEIEGCKKISREAVRSLVLMEGIPNLFTLRLREIARRLEGHPWVNHATIRKVFPDKVRIEIEERKPMAILQMEELSYIDEEGVIFSPARDGDGFNFPFLTGLTRQALEKDPEASRELLTGALEFLRLAQRMKSSPLEEISEIHMSRSFGIDCYAKESGLEVKMGRGSFAEKLRRLSIVWSDLRKRGLFAECIDSNDLDRIVVTKSNAG